MEVKLLIISPGNQQRAQTSESAPRADRSGEGTQQGHANALPWFYLLSWKVTTQLVLLESITLLSSPVCKHQGRSWGANRTSFQAREVAHAEPSGILDQELLAAGRLGCELDHNSLDCRVALNGTKILWFVFGWRGGVWKQKRVIHWNLQCFSLGQGDTNCS